MWSVCLSVHLLGTEVSPAKMADPIEMPFGGLAHIGPMMGSSSLHEKGQFWGLSCLVKSIGVYAAKEIIQFSMTYDAAFCQNSFTNVFLCRILNKNFIIFAYFVNVSA